MAPPTAYRRIRRATAGMAAALLLASCGSSTPSKPVIVGSLVGFDHASAVTQNGVIPSAEAGLACGSRTTTFGTELLETSPAQAKVTDEWGQVVPGVAMQATGTVQHFTFSNGDLPFTHPFGRDVTLDVALDRPFSKLEQLSGTAVPPGPLDDLHWEITKGLVPHLDTATYLDGFIPQDGDHIATLGPWVVDCGHSDYHTEIHPAVFTAFGHAEGGATVAHAFYSPYRELQLYTPIADNANAVQDAARLSDPDTQAFPQFLVKEILRAGHVGPEGPLCCHDRLETHHLLGANRFGPVSWYVCAPPGSTGSGLSVSYGFTVRPGVKLTVTPMADIGCVRFDAAIGDDYQAVDPARKDCLLPWEVLDQQAQAATGNPALSVKSAIDKLVPPSFLKNVNKQPLIDCYDPLVVPAPSETGQHIVTSAGQPYPFYGFAKVSRTAGG